MLENLKWTVARIRNGEPSSFVSARRQSTYLHGILWRSSCHAGVRSAASLLLLGARLQQTYSRQLPLSATVWAVNT